MECKEEGCTSSVAARGWCRKHYTRWHRYGDVGPTPKQARSRTVACAAEGCGVSFTTHAAGSRKYCSVECFRSSYEHRPARKKTCKHCSVEYQPAGRSQKYCAECLGPAIPDKNGVLRYAGRNRLAMYGVSHSEWLRMLTRYAGMCWICKSSPASDLDHRHSDGAPRGALCGKCNTRLHVLEEEQWIEAAKVYLEESSSPPWWENPDS